MKRIKQIMMLLAVALLPTEVLAQEIPMSGTSGDLDDEEPVNVGDAKGE